MVKRMRRLSLAVCAAILLSIVAPVASARSASGIIGGEPVADQRWPWMVAVVVDDLYVCGGAIVSTTAVVTAEHCFAEEVGVVEVQVGGLRLGDGDRIGVAAVHRHAEADLAVLELASPIEPTAAAFAIPAAAADQYGGGDTAWIVGWGSTDAENHEVVASLHQVAVPIVSDEACSKIFPLQFQAPTEICAGGDGVGSCLGDSGGPLMVERDTGWVLVGVVSRSALPCAAPGSPTIFTELAPLATWLQQILDPPVVEDKAPAPPPPDLEDQPTIVDPPSADLVVATGYTEAEYATLASAAAQLGLAPQQLQKTGVYVLRFLTVLSGNDEPQPLAVQPDTSGPVAVESTWSDTEVEALRWGVGHYGGSEATTQKVGATLLSFLAALAS